jgi:uncharacterized protein (DUF433 family)
MSQAWTKHLVARRDVLSGALCVRGTRIPVAVILDSLAEGASEDQILRSYPTLRSEHIRAALAYAADLAHEEQVIPLIHHAPQARREPARRGRRRSA